MPLKADKLYVVVPCYNEEAVLPETTRRLGEKLHAMMAAGSISADSRVLFVDDGSRDRTWELIEQAHAQDELFTGAKLSRNRGHQNALLAGLMLFGRVGSITILLAFASEKNQAASKLPLEKIQIG